MNSDISTQKIQTPNWWDKTYDSGWDRFKAAFKRDWEQTKADLTGARAGTDLNQQAGDTFAQARGEQAIPVGTHPNLDDVEDLEVAHDRAIKAREDRAVKLGEAMDYEREASNARMEGDAKKADRKVEKAVDKRIEAADAAAELSRWQRAEAAARFGYGARQHYDAQPWQSVSARIREDWELAYPNDPWEQASPNIQRGWGYFH